MILQRLGNRGIGLGTLFERAARRDPTNVLLLDRPLDTAPELGRSISMAAVAEHVADLAGRLHASGVRPGERVAVHKSANADIPILACAATRIGAVPMLLSPSLDGDTVRALLLRGGRPHLVTDAATLTGSLPPGIEEATDRVLLTTGADPRATTLTDGEVSGVDPVEMPPDQPALITHTSGTTGLPKLAVHTARTLQARFRPQWAATATIRGRELVVMKVSPVHSRLFTAAAITLLRGWPMMFLLDDDLAATADLFSRFRPGVVEAHPNTLMRWEPLTDDPRRPLGGVRLFSSTFDALHPSTVERLLAASHRRRPRFAQLYGQSEVGPVAGRMHRRGERPADGRCVGRPFPGMTDVRIVSRDGRRPTAANPGFLEARTDGRVLTYLAEDARYRDQLDGDWWRMGDLGYRDRRGRVHLLDRAVDEIPGFGSTLSIEDALFRSIPDLAEVIIVPLPDRGAVPVVCTKGDVPLDPGVWAAATAGLPTMAAPVQLRLSDLPTTATTKIKRLELTERLASASIPGAGE